MEDYDVWRRLQGVERLAASRYATSRDVSASAGIDDRSHGMGAAWGDYYNDGDLDLFVVNASTLQEEDDPRLLVPMRDQLASEFPRNVDYQGYLGVLAVRRLDRNEARQISEGMKGLANAYDGRDRYWQGRIARAPRRARSCDGAVA